MKATNVSLAELLFPAQTRRKALSILLLHPDQHLHVREIARLAGSPAGTMVKELDRLHDAGLLLKQRIGNQVHFSANQASAVFHELAALLKKTVGLADVLVDALSALKPKITFAFVFGSVARGTESARSDVDVIIVGDVDFQSVISALYPAQSELQREINPKIYSLEEWNDRARAGSAFISEVLSRPKIFLIGNEDALHAPG